MNETVRLRRMLEIVVYQYTLVDTLKGNPKLNLESSTRDLFDLITINCQGLAQVCKDPESRKNTALSMIERLKQIEAKDLEELNRKTLPIK